jgi:hypothetical protein
MSIERFYRQIDLARGLMGRPRVAVDSPQAGDPAALADDLQRSDLWLSWRIVADFEPREFDFLERGARDRLAAAVRQFEVVAKEVPPDGPATAEQSRRGREAIHEICEVLELETYDTPDLFKAAKVLERVGSFAGFPGELEDVVFEFGLNWDDERVARVWGILRPDETARGKLLSISDRLKQLIEELFVKYGVAIRPVVNLRSYSEQQRLGASAAAGPGIAS